MKRTLFVKAFSIAGFLLANVCLLPQPAGAATIHLTGSSIQAAVNAAHAGDTILVPAGTYAEPQIIVDKAISLLGEDANTTIIDGGNNGAAMTGVGLVQITADNGNVTFSGFTLKNAGHVKADGHAKGVSVGIYASSTSRRVTYLITHNRIIGSNDPTDDGDYGLFAPSGFETLLFLENEITATGSNPILVQFHVGATDISGNKLDVGPFGSDAIFTLTAQNVDITTLQQRNDNVIDAGTGSIFDDEHRATGIVFASAYRKAPYDTDNGGGRFTKVQVMRNTIMRIQAGRRGITLWNGSGTGLAGDIPGAMIQGNMLTGMDRAVGSKGIQLLGVITGAKLVNNTMRGLDIGIHLRAWVEGAPTKGAPIGAKITANRFQAVNTPVSTDAEALDTKHHADHISP